MNTAYNKPGKETMAKPAAWQMFACRCPRCRRGEMFQNSNPWRLRQTMRMHKQCAVCGQPFNLEVGFYYGSGYISYALTVALSGVTFAVWWLTIGFSLDDNRVWYWLGFNAVFLLLLQPYLMRLARTGWLWLFVGYDPHWPQKPPPAPERTNEEQETNW